MPIDPGLLKRLDLDEALSTVTIAAKLGYADTTILRHLRRAGIDVRPRGPVPRSRAESNGIDWSPTTAYALGLMATDGNLSGRRGHLSLVSKYLEQIEPLRRCLHLESRIARVPSPTGCLHKVQWCDRGLYDWFVSVGLTPAKSRIIGPLSVPDEPFADFFCGCIDGDGSVLVYIDRYHATRHPRYVYERLYVSVVSASRRFLEWIQASIGRIVRVRESYPGCTTRRMFPAWPESAPRRSSSSRRRAMRRHDQSGDPELGGCTLTQPVTRRGSGPGWCNGSHAGLKIQCPRGRAGSTPAPGTIP